MRKLREVARLFLELKLGVRPIARACNISTSTAHTYMEKLRELGAGYREIMEMNDDSLSDLLFPKGEQVVSRPLPDFVYLTGEMKKKGVTFSCSMKNTREIIPGDTRGASFITFTETGPGKQTR